MSLIASRRRLLAMAMAAGTALSLEALAPRRSLAADAPAKVDEKDSLSVALGYVADAKRVDAKANPNFQAGSSCSGCSWFQGKAGDAAGACTFFPDKLVDARGWCKMWNKKQ